MVICFVPDNVSVVPDLANEQKAAMAGVLRG